jgi:site-specific DNA-methyltransferase (adenine-specific)
LRPYYDADSIRIYHARWGDVWPTLGIKHEDVALLWADPPYGTMGKAYSSESATTRNGGKRWAASAVPHDDAPFDPAPLLGFPRAVLWGAQYYASRLPDSAAWWTWDKKGQDWDCTAGDAELAWTNLEGVVRTARIPWYGGRGAEGYVHPTQKPVALATWGFQRAKLKPGNLVFSPYMGSGPEARAALDMGLRYIGCEIVEEYCKAAVNRLRQLPLLAEGV